MVAQVKENCDFYINHKKEKWHIISVWLTPNRKACWYEGETERKGVRFLQIFSPSEINIPMVKKAKYLINDF